MTIPDYPTCFVEAAASNNTVFVDTSLGTHLAMAVSDGDTVFDVKEKIEKEHPLCFPHLGAIKIHAIKVTRRGYFYHLSDSMYLKSAFVGYDDSWFLSIDASTVDGHSTDPNTGSVARNNHSGHLPNYDAQKLKDIVAQQYVNEEAPDSCHSSKRDLMIEKAEVTHSVKNRSKHQSSRTMNDCEGFNEKLESLPAVKQNHRSKKSKTILINEHKFANHTSDDNDQNPLQQVVGSNEKSKEYAHNEVSDHPMMESKSNVDEHGQISSSDTGNVSESENERKRKYNLPDEAEISGKNDKSKYLIDNTAFKVAAQAESIVEKIHKTEMTIRVMNGVEGNRDLVSESRNATSTSKVTSEYLPDEKQTPQVVIGSLSTEPYAHLLKSASSGVKKRKKKSKSELSGCPNQVVDLISSRVGDQQDASRESDIATVPSRDVEEKSIPDLLETSTREVQYESIDKTAESYAPPLVGESHGDKNNIELPNVQSIMDASDKPVLGGMVGSEDLASKSKDPTDLQKSIGTSEDANNVQRNHLTHKTEKFVAVLEERDSLQIADAKASMVENCHSSSWDGTNADTNSKAMEISKLVHLKGTAEKTKHGKKKKIKKSRESAEERQINLVTAGARDSAQDISTEMQSCTLGDNSCSKAEIGERNVSLMKGENTTNTSILPDVRNIDLDKPNTSKVEPLLQINKTQAVAKDMDGQVRKKTKKRPVASMKSTPDLQAESIGNEDSFSSKRNDREVKPVSIAAKKTKFSKSNFRNEIEEEENLDSTRFSEVEISPSYCKKSKTVRSSLNPSHISEGYEDRYVEANRFSNTTEDCNTGKVDDVEVPSESNKVGIEENADRFQHESVKLQVDNLSREKSVNTLLKAKRKKKDPSACSSAASLSMQNAQKSDENTENEGHCLTSNSSALQLRGSSSKDKCDAMLHVDNKLKKISRGGVKSLPSNEPKQKTSDSNQADGVRGKVVDSSRDSTEIYSETSSLPKTKPKMKKSANMVYHDQKRKGHQSTGIGRPEGGRKSSQTGKKDVTQSQRRNVLLTSGGIFKDASSDSSEDEAGIVDSDASTKSPDNSQISDFSDGESNESVDLERTNIRRSRRKNE
ncbi:dentin sialophosphoprotein isoform X2 [Cucumis sativus]|uniref:dentin sialophosphoprotein isoform X2 n=1 Tax=Cucumis sativus TaxID=3659 RepID=UPI0012F4C614|nr:dentin sialophosphoprotein isoform X2 [Cucumis sativus]